jgi:DNA-binding MurR/RpiR family transcriptional regulator
MMGKANMKVRLAMMETGTPQWKLAELLGVSESTIWRMIRKEQPDKEQDRIVWIIKNPDKYKEMTST